MSGANADKNNFMSWNIFGKFKRNLNKFFNIANIIIANIANKGYYLNNFN